MRGTISFAVPTAEELLGGPRLHAPQDRISLYAERARQIARRYGCAVPREVSIFAEPDLSTPACAEMNGATNSTFERAEPCRACGGHLYRRYPDSRYAGRTNERCVTCIRLRIRRNKARRTG